MGRSGHFIQKTSAQGSGGCPITAAHVATDFHGRNSAETSYRVTGGDRTHGELTGPHLRGSWGLRVGNPTEAQFISTSLQPAAPEPVAHARNSKLPTGI